MAKTTNKFKQSLNNFEPWNGQYFKQLWGPALPKLLIYIKKCIYCQIICIFLIKLWILYENNDTPLNGISQDAWKFLVYPFSSSIRTCRIGLMTGLKHIPRSQCFDMKVPAFIVFKWFGRNNRISVREPHSVRNVNFWFPLEHPGSINTPLQHLFLRRPPLSPFVSS